MIFVIAQEICLAHNIYTSILQEERYLQIEINDNYQLGLRITKIVQDVA